MLGHMREEMRGYMREHLMLRVDAGSDFIGVRDSTATARRRRGFVMVALEVERRVLRVTREEPLLRVPRTDVVEFVFTHRPKAGVEHQPEAVHAFFRPRPHARNLHIA